MNKFTVYRVCHL